MNVLLTGATGYIGRRLMPILIKDENVHLRLFVRDARKVQLNLRDKVEIFEGNTFNTESLRKALDGIDIAYYLIHSLGAKGDFRKLDRISATNFRDACIDAAVKRIIYLGGLGDKRTASKHLLSRIETGEILSARPNCIQTIWFRAGIIIGSGSASFEIIRNYVQKLPIMITPKWVFMKTQPISNYDVLEYLYQAKDLDVKGNLIVDIGSEEMTFQHMLIKAAEVMGLKRRLIPVPFLTPKLSSYWLILLTPVAYRIARALVEGLKSETILQNDNAKKYFPSISPVCYAKAVEIALSEIENDQVLSRWCDSSAREECDIKNQDRIAEAVSFDRKVAKFGEVPAKNIFDAVQSIGGRSGWFRANWVWKLRGLIDKLLAGPGLNRGRRHPIDLRIGDSLDFWKVVDLKEGKRLLLLSQMKLPGKVWLEFSIEDEALVQTFYFLPKGLLGRLYWVLTKPFHIFAFSGIAKGIIKRAQELAVGHA